MKAKNTDKDGNGVFSKDFVVDGRRVHVLQSHHSDEGPVVVIVPALGFPALMYTRVQELLAPLYSTVCFDRPGTGLSSPSDAPADAQTMAEDLYKVVRLAVGNRPLILIGHSLGGLVARVFAKFHPDLVAGLILVESSHPDQKLDRKILASVDAWMMNYIAELERAREIGTIHPHVAEFAAPFRDRPAVQDQIVSLLSTRLAAEASMKEWRDFEKSCEQSGVVVHLGDLPLTVITACTPSVPAEIGIDPKRQQLLWLAFQKDLTSLTSDAAWVQIDEARHNLTSEAKYAPIIVSEVVKLATRVSVRCAGRS